MDWPWGSRAAYEAMYRDSLAYHEGEMHATGRDGFWKRDAEYLRAAVCRLRLYRELYPRALTLIDFGAGTGAMVALAGAFGFREAVGAEPNDSMVLRARALGRDVRSGDCLSPHDNCFDLVTLHDVLEHLLEPLKALEALSARLALGGRLIVEMPLLPYDPAQWPTFRHRKPREHPFLYSELAARWLFAQAGLTVYRTHAPRNGTIGKMAYHLGRD